ncbi:MAG: hypothetical protein IJ329_00660 [Clostridia bacterium]|nr:hypothetical protein [Clostridia bacterium]
MKKRIFALIALTLYVLSVFLFPPVKRLKGNAAADGETYACICTDAAYFYAAKNENNGLFLLPQTYFVKVLSVEADYCRIEYLYDSEYTQKLSGYAKTEDLTFVDFTPNEPYLYHVFNVRYTIDGSFSTDDSFLDQITVTCAYYGDYNIGSKTYCYVLRGDSFGYIPKPVDLYYAENTEYEDYLSQLSQAPVATPPSSDDGAGMSAAQIAILITLCLLVPLIAALVLKTSKRNTYDLDENG